MDNNYCVYKHTSPSGKVYIGITGRKPEQRWANGKGYVHNKHFSNAINKYGWDNFEHEILLDGLSEAQASEFEKLYISIFKSDSSKFGYNKTTGGEVGYHFLGENRVAFVKAMRDPQRRKNISAGVKKYYENPENRKKASEAQLKKWANPELRRRQGEIVRKNNSNPKTKAKQSEVRRKRWKNPEYRASMSGGNNPIARRIEQYSLDGKYIKTFDCVEDAVRELGKGSHANIVACAKGRMHKVYGYIWLYEDEQNKAEMISKKMNASMKGANHPRARAIDQYDLDGNFIKHFETISEASRFYGISSGNIGSCLVGRRKKAFNSIWKYSTED